MEYNKSERTFYLTGKVFREHVQLDPLVVTSTIAAILAIHTIYPLF